MSRTVLAFFMILCSLSAVFLVGFKATVRGSPSFHVHNIDTGLDYVTIQEAIDANETLNEHSIHVDAGIYYENVVINKSIKLIGEDKKATIIDGNDAGNVVHITVENVTIVGFTIQNSMVYRGGICVEETKSANISDNIVKDNDYGIELRNSTNNILSQNEMLDNWPGIKLEISYNNTICGNTISHNKEGGIRLSASRYNLIFNNMLSNNRLEAIALINANFNFIV